MLQIVQGMYFRPVPLYKKLHRGVFFTNICAFREGAISLPFGRLLPSTNFQGVRSLTIEADEQLESVTLTGQPEILAATSGHQLLDEVADVIAFALNGVCVRDHDMARRLVSRDGDEHSKVRGPASILRQTFDTAKPLSDARISDLDAFLQRLISLKRTSYESAMRAIRQIVDATQIVDEDATLAYTLMVAALESLGQAAEPPGAHWDEYDPDKRARIDQATKGLGLARQARIQAAVLENEHLALQRRFVAFVLGHVGASFYRDEAIGAIRPISAVDLPNALRQAYAIRSRNIHALAGLDPEVWMSAQQADTVLARSGLVLSLEGLARLCRHVVRRFIEVAPKGVDQTFNYRTALPGLIRGHLAPQYWIQFADGFNRKSAPAYLNGMIEYLIEGLSKRSDSGLVEMSAILDRVERSARSLTKRVDRLAMAGIMSLWNTFAPIERRRKLNPKLAAVFEEDLSEPSMIGFAIWVLVGGPSPWNADTLEDLSRARMGERLRKNAQPLPARIDAALHLVVADAILRNGALEQGLIKIGHAVETVPGLSELIEYERRISRGEHPVLHLQRFILGEPDYVDSKPQPPIVDPLK